MKKLVFFVLLALALSPAAFAAGNATSVTVAVGAEASITVGASTALTEAGNFANYAGSTTFTYLIRTTPSTGTGSVTVKVTTDFSPVGGPSVATPAAGDSLTYNCTASGTSAPTACSGPVTALTTAATNVLTVGADKHSTLAGDSGTVNWTLTNDPNYKVASYTSTVTFTVAAA
jgi:hypothetical protein